MKIIIDFDGPIVDVSPRYYFIYRALTEKYGATHTLSKDEYWSLKRKRTPIPEILKLSGLPASAHLTYINERLSIIENKEFLAYDRLYPFVPGVIKELSVFSEIYIVTLRNRRENLSWQLSELDIGHLFPNVYSLDNNDGTWEVKKRLVLDAQIMENGEKTYFVGDTEADVLAANDLNAISVAVESGIRNREMLEALNPDFIIPDISTIGKLIRDNNDTKSA
ncbi:hypothetical protein MNBD_NITROSPINAE03-80 [hydrothermal vent metagenome]|uniref:Haloacid dehalogenase-like hydrolase n=1 Tax=hydrothermal vent metagenome TaxID=652676 RepID=A0A3B1CGC5_9ZZZZ